MYARYAIIVVAIIVIVALGATAYFLYPRPRPFLTVKVGLIVPLSGPHAASGDTMKKAALLAVKDIQKEIGLNITLIVADSEGKPATAVIEAKRLITKEGVFALIGGYTSAEAVALSEVAAEHKIPIIFSGGTASLEVTDKVLRDPVKYKYVFRVSYNTTGWAMMIGNYIANVIKAKSYWFEGFLPLKKWAEEFDRELEAFMAPKGLKKVGFDIYGKPEEIPASLAKIRAAEPDVIVLADPSPVSYRFIVEHASLKMKPILFSVGGALADPEAPAKVGKALNYVVFNAAAWDTELTPKTKCYFDEYRRSYGEESGTYAAPLTYDAVSILARAIKKAGKFDVDKVIEILETESFEGVCGVYRFTRAHQANWFAPGLTGLILQWYEGKAYVLWPEEVKQAEFRVL